MLFGSNRDFDLLVNINRELLKDIIEQEVIYYKINLDQTVANLKRSIICVFKRRFERFFRYSRNWWYN